MKRLLVIGATVGTLAALSASASAQGRGEFPEQPGANVQRGCTAISASEANALSGVASQHQNEQARIRNFERYVDGCLGG